MANGAVTLAAVGDLMLGDHPATPGWGFLSRYSENEVLERLARLRTLFNDSEIVFGNLETVLASSTTAGSRWSALQMRGRPEFAKGLARGGFTVLNVANNHAMQHGPQAFMETVRVLERAGIRVCGLRGDRPWSSKPIVIEKQDIRVGFLGFSFRPRQYGAESALYAEGEMGTALADVRRLKNRVDHVVVSLHWGEEFVSLPSKTEAAFARRLLTAGTTLLLGHHPHVRRPVVVTDAGIVAYSLGNFISDMVWEERLREAVLLRCTLETARVRAISGEVYRIGNDFFPSGKSNPSSLLKAADEVRTLSDVEYASAVARELRKYRSALYRHALRNVWRYPPDVLLGLGAKTCANKLLAAKQRVFR